MQKRLAFFIALTLSLVAVLLLDTQASGQVYRIERQDEKHKSEKKKHDNRREKIIVRPGVRPNVQVYRPGIQAVRPSVRVARPPLPPARPAAPRIYRAEAYSGNYRYSENNAAGSFAQVARINGYQDGLNEGAKDARDGDRYDPFAEDDYQDGDGGYRSIYGDRQTYKQLYRQSFLRGYREAFNRYLGSQRPVNW